MPRAIGAPWRGSAKPGAVSLRRPLLAAGTYATVAGSWIILSSSAVDNSSSSASLEILKGLAFVGVTTALLFGLLVAHDHQSAEVSRRLRELIESSGDITYRYRLWPTPGFEYISDAVVDWTGITPEQHYAQPDVAFHLVHPDDRHRLATLHDQGSTVEPAFLRWVTPSGEVVHTQHDTREIRDRRGRRVAVDGRIRNVTDNRRDRAEAEAGAATLRWLASGLDGSDVIVKLTTCIVDTLEADIAWVGVPVPDGSVRPVAAAGDPEWVAGLQVRWDDGPLARGPTGTAIRERRAVVSSSVDPDYAPWRQQEMGAGVVASLAVPILWRGEVTGTLNVYSRFGNPFDDPHVERFERMALRLAFALRTSGPPSAIAPLGAVTAPTGLLPFDVAAALRDGRVEAWWQPQVAPVDGRIVAAEALVRVRDVDGRVVPPTVVLPAAEEAGLMVPLGRAVRRIALARAVPWLQGRLDRISLNVTVAELVAPGFTTEVLDLLRQHQVPASQIELELVETGPVDDAALRILTRLHQAGIRIAVDDYGSGWASLGHLARLPATTLKIDRIFVRDLGRSARADALVASTCELGRQLDVLTVAEGVENEDQAERLAAMGCDLLQGFLYAAPLDADTFEAFLGAPAVATC